MSAFVPLSVVVDVLSWITISYILLNLPSKGDFKEVWNVVFLYSTTPAI